MSRELLKKYLSSAFITCESGNKGYLVKAKFPTLEEAQNFHSALIGISQDSEAEPVAWMDDRGEVISDKWLKKHGTSDYRAAYNIPLYKAKED